MTARILTCLIETLETLSPEVYRVFLRGEPAEVMHAPGQYLEIRVGEAWVPFSIANAPDSAGTLELHIQYVPQSESSVRLFELLQVGQTLDIRLASGTCVFDLDDPRPLLLIAAGTGFAQMKAIIEAALAHDSNRIIQLWWAGRQREDLYLEALPRHWAQAYPQFSFYPVVELPGEHGFDGVVERIDKALSARITGTRDASIFISGSPGMVYAVVDTLEAIEPLTERVFSDVFSYAPRAAFTSGQEEQ